MHKIKYRIYYALLLVFLLICSFLSANPLLLTCAGIWVLIPFLFKLTLSLSARHLRLDCTVRSAGVVGRGNAITITVRNAHTLLVSGVLHLRVRYTSPMFRIEMEEEYQLSCANGQTRFTPFILNDLCGRVNIACVEVVCSDLLGLCHCNLAPFPECSTVIFPEQPDLNIFSATNKMGHTQGDQVYLNVRGKDPGEVYDLRDYMSGDDTRSIHWKLFGKTDALIVRENSKPTDTHHALLFDACFSEEGGGPSAKLITSALGLAAALGQQFIRQSIPYQAIFTARSRLYTASIRSLSEQYDRLQTWLELPLPEKGGTGLDLFVAEGLSRRFARLFYITVGSIPENLLLSGTSDVTVICLVEDGDDIQVDTHEACRLMRIPVARLNDKTFNLPI